MEYSTRSRVINSIIKIISENQLTYREAYEILGDTKFALQDDIRRKTYENSLSLLIDYDVKVENLEHLIGSSDNW